jgi:hypothetical protein
MVTTRSSSKASQAHPDASPAIKANASQSPKKTVKKSPAQPNTKRKRKASETKNSPSKRLKKEQSPDDEDAATKIIVNRAPVLELWGASVAHFAYPDLPWSTCVSIGSAISTICAVAKGRSIGTVSEKNESELKRKKKQDAKRNQKDLDEVEVMQFKLKLKDGLAIVGSEQKGKPANEQYLKKKFGDDHYQRVRKTFEQALQNWKGDEDDLNKQAFRFYEQFRPNVSPGQKGWGRKGELDLNKVQTVLHK